VLRGERAVLGSRDTSGRGVMARKEVLKCEQDGEERLALFYRLCGLCFTALYNNCGVPIGIELRRFQLVEGDFHEGDHEEVHAWLKDVDTKLLEMVITFQKIVLDG